METHGFSIYFLVRQFLIFLLNHILIIKTFSGYSSDHELVQFIEYAMIVVKHEFLKATTVTDKIGCIYLMYILFFKQPTKQYCKFRFTLEEWVELDSFYKTRVAGKQYDQVRLIFWKLLQAHAFR